MANNGFKLVRELNALVAAMGTVDDSFLEPELRHRQLAAVAVNVNDQMHSSNASRDAAKVATRERNAVVTDAASRIDRVHAGFRMKFGAASPEYLAVTTTRMSPRRRKAAAPPSPPAAASSAMQPAGAPASQPAAPVAAASSPSSTDHVSGSGALPPNGH